MAAEKFLTIGETAIHIKMSKRSVQRLVSRGDLPVVRFGRSVRVPMAVLDALATTALSRFGDVSQPARAS